jgi:hypothetical protein
MAKAARLYNVRSWLMCDDIRIETSGKYLLIGVYSGTMKVRRSLPVTLPTLSFWIQLELQKLDYGDYELRLLDPNNREAAHFRGLAHFARADEPAVLICLTGPITLSKYGTYRVEFGMGGAPGLLGTFAVRSSDEPAGAYKTPESTYPAQPGFWRQH